MTFYKLKVKPVEAIQYTGENHKEIAEFLRDCDFRMNTTLEVRVLGKEWVDVDPSDWITRGDEGAYVYIDEIFKQGFEVA